MKEKCNVSMLILLMILALVSVGCGVEEEKASKKEEEKRTETIEQEDLDEEIREEEEEGISTEVLINKMIEAYKGQKVTQEKLSGEIELDGEIQGKDVGYDMYVETELSYSFEPYRAYSDTTVSLNQYGQQASTNSIIYIVEENGVLVNYVNADNTGWFKSGADMTMDEVMNNYETGLDWLLEREEDDFDIEDELQVINGREAYKINVELKGQEIQQILKGMTGASDLGVMAYSTDKLTILGSYYVDAENYRILKIELELEGMEEVLRDMTNELITDSGADDLDVKISVNKCRIVVDKIAYEAVELPEIPEIGKDTSADIYMIENSGVIAQITLPQDWSIIDSDESSVRAEHDEMWQMFEIAMFSNMGREEFWDNLENVLLPKAESSGIYISHGEGPEINSFETVEVLCDELNIYFGWRQVGECGIVVTVTDMEGVELEDALTPVFEMIEIVQENAS